MSLRRFLNVMCPIICGSCLVVGYALVGQWVAIPVVLIAALTWFGIHRWPFAWLSSATLAINVGLAATGLLTGASPVLMILGATFGLACWDLMNFDRVLTGDSSDSVTARLGKEHYQSLGLALGPGLLAALMGRAIHFQIPFVGMVLLVMFTLLALDRVWRLLTD